MALSPPAAFALDALSLAFCLALAAFFARLIRFGGGWQALITAGFVLLGVSYVGVTASAATPGPTRWDLLRVSGQLGGGLAILLGYLGARVPGRAAWVRVGAAVVVAAGLLIGLTLLGLPAADGEYAAAILRPQQATLALAFLACAVFAMAGLRDGLRFDRVLAPSGFAALAVAKLAWFVQESPGVPWQPYALRLLGLALLVTAMALPVRDARRRRRAHATT